MLPLHISFPRKRTKRNAKKRVMTRAEKVDWLREVQRPVEHSLLGLKRASLPRERKLAVGHHC